MRILSIAALEDEYLAQEAERSFTQAMVERRDGVLRLDRAAVALMRPAIQARVMRYAITSLAGGTQGVTYNHIQSILQMIGKRGRARRLNLPEGITVGAEYGSVLIKKPGEKTTGGFYHEIHEPGTFCFPGAGIRLAVQLRPNAFGIDLKQCPPRRAYLDAQRCTFPLTIRSPLPGDRFQPLGMNMVMKLKDYFIHQHIPRSSRARTPLLISQQKIAWVAGLRLDERFKVERHEAPMLTVEVTPVQE